MFNLSGRVALVTGASRGIGRAIARRLGDQGAIVIAAARRDHADATARELTAVGHTAEAVPLFMQMSDGILHQGRQPWMMVASWLFVSIISLLATTVPMQLALRRVESLEM